MLLNHALHAVALGTRDEGVLQLLRVDTGCVLAEQRDGVIGSDDALHHLFVFEQANPFCEAILLGRAFRRGIIGSAGADEGARIFWGTHPGIDGLGSSLFSI